MDGKSNELEVYLESVLITNNEVIKKLEIVASKLKYLEKWFGFGGGQLFPVQMDCHRIKRIIEDLNNYTNLMIKKPSIRLRH